MSEVRERLDAVMLLAFSEKVFKGTSDFLLETQFLQLRKVLEVMAFASLTANQAKYAAAHAKFATHWNAARMLGCLEEINPDFYPMPAVVRKVAPGPNARIRWEYQVVRDGFLSRDDFVFLYDTSSMIVHTRNPFSPNTPVEIRYDIPVWVERIRSLLRIHFMHFVDDRRWLVYVPDVGKIVVETAMSDPSVV